MTTTTRLASEWQAWQAIVRAVEDYDVGRGRRPRPPDDELVAPSPLLAACEDALATVERLVWSGGHWQGEWVPKRRRA